jgi:DNA-binding transcriptional regulator YiaG
VTPEQIEEAARRDPDARPLTPDDLKRMRRTPQVKIIRRALGLTQEEFAARYRIPVGTLRDLGSSREADRRAHRARPTGARLSHRHRARSRSRAAGAGSRTPVPSGRSIRRIDA